MEFNNNKPIYLQIVDSVCERILNGELRPESRLMSVRELGAELEVNPNTVMRSYERMTDAGIIYNKRGIGYFISADAKSIVRSTQQKYFLEEELPAILRKMKLLDINPDLLAEEIRNG